MNWIMLDFDQVTYGCLIGNDCLHKLFPTRTNYALHPKFLGFNLSLIVLDDILYSTNTNRHKYMISVGALNYYNHKLGNDVIP